MITKCPNCGSELIFYHSYGDGITRVVCKNKCQGWKVLQEILFEELQGHEILN